MGQFTNFTTVGGTAMPGGLHAMLCHALLVSSELSAL